MSTQRVTETLVIGRYFIAGRARKRGWFWPERWEIYSLRDAAAREDAPRLWFAESRDECVEVVAAFDSSVTRPDATRTDSVCNPVEPPDVK